MGGVGWGGVGWGKGGDNSHTQAKICLKLLSSAGAFLGVSECEVYL